MMFPTILRATPLGEMSAEQRNIMPPTAVAIRIMPHWLSDSHLSFHPGSPEGESARPALADLIWVNAAVRRAPDPSSVH
ncbi:MAG TPA: hypothetical protein VMI56_28515 [Reyranella sp.]|nr:hypothetical protein [Reyranella sp.]